MEAFGLLKKGSDCRSLDSVFISDGEMNLNLRMVQKLRAWFNEFLDAPQKTCLVVATDNVFLKAAAIVAGEGLFAQMVVISEDNLDITYSQFSESSILSLIDKTRDSKVSENIREISGDKIAEILNSDQIVEANTEYNPLDSFTKLYLTTSGTTGVPKFVEHNFYSLTKTTKVNPGYGMPVWGLVYPLERFAGLQVFLQVLIGGGLLISTVTQGADIQSKLKLFEGRNVTHISATPSAWRQFMMSSTLLSSLKQITLGGEIADQRILDQLAKMYPLARISHVYASTEAGASFSVSDKIAGFPVSYLEDKELGLKIVENELLIRAEENTGRRLSYISGEGAFASDGWIRTGDRVEVSDDRVYFLGRLSGVINVGGTKVHPEEVEFVALELAGISSAYAFSKPNPILGNVVALEIIPTSDLSEEDAANFLAEVKEHCKRRLPAPNRPMSIKISENFELMSSGKLKR